MRVHHWGKRGREHLLDQEQLTSIPTDNKIVLHCSAGIGRTGTLTAIYNLQQTVLILHDYVQRSKCSFRGKPDSLTLAFCVISERSFCSGGEAVGLRRGEEVARAAILHGLVVELVRVHLHVYQPLAAIARPAHSKQFLAPASSERRLSDAHGVGCGVRLHGRWCPLKKPMKACLLLLIYHKGYLSVSPLSLASHSTLINTFL